MKKIIRKFWGIGIIVVLLSSLLVAAVPVSAADPLNWEAKTDAPAAIPFAVLAPGTDVVDFAVNGMTMYAVTGVAPGAGTKAVMQSTSGGAMWTDVSTRMPASGDIGTADFVTMAPDDPTFIVVADATPAAGLCAAISTNGGATWSSMGAVRSSTNVNVTGVKGVTISPIVTGGFRYIAIYGTAGADLPGLYYYNYGPGIGSWKNACLGAVPDFVTPPVLGAGAVAYDNVVAFQFSPNFPSDFMAVAVMEDVGTLATGAVDYHILSFNSFKWDTPVAAQHPKNIYTGSGVLVTPGLTVNKASLALLPDYDGSDESLRIAFVAASITDGTTGLEVGGVWRCFDGAPAAGRVFGSVAGLGPGIASIAYDGTNLAAGAYLTNGVWRSADSLAATPTFLGGRNYKQIGVSDPAVNDTVIVKFDGTTLYGAKIGNASAISKSADYGNTWADYTLLDNAITVADDIWMSATGDPWYLASHDATTTAVFRIAARAVTRVLCVYPADAAAFILRGISSDANVIYAADTTALANIFYTADGGVSRWYKRIAPATIADLAVESQSVIYIGATAGITVYKSTNGGFTWGLPVNCKLTGANTVYSMLSLGDSKLIVGGTAGGVVYSTDGGTTWTATLGVAGGVNIMVAASGLAADNYIFAADKATNAVYRSLIGPTNPAGEFKTMNMLAVVAAETNTGIALTNGVLYVVAASATTTYLSRTLAPTIPGGYTWSRFAEATPALTRTLALPPAFRVSSGAPGDIMLYGIDTIAQGVYYFQDTLALNSPTLTGPADKALVQLTSALLGTSQNVNFTWNKLSFATHYNLAIALDAGFTQPVAIAAPANPIFNPGPIVSAIVPGGNFQPGITYYWRVQTNTPLFSVWSQTRSFTVQQVAASVPENASPINGATGISDKPSFSWSPVAGTTKYEFQLSDTTNFDIAMFSEKLANTGIQPAGLTLKAGKTYFWRVRAYEPNQGDWSSIANFTVAVPVTPPPTPIVTMAPTPTIIVTVPAAPAVTLTVPVQEEKVINPTYIWAIIIIGAVLVIAVIVLIVRTRRSV